MSNFDNQSAMVCGHELASALPGASSNQLAAIRLIGAAFPDEWGAYSEVYWRSYWGEQARLAKAAYKAEADAHEDDSLDPVFHKQEHHLDNDRTQILGASLPPNLFRSLFGYPGLPEVEPIAPFSSTSASASAASSSSSVSVGLSQMAATMSSQVQVGSSCVECDCARRKRAGVYEVAKGYFRVAANLPKDKGRYMRLEFHEKSPQESTIVMLVQTVKCDSGPTLDKLDHEFSGGALAGINKNEDYQAYGWRVDAPGIQTIPGFGLKAEANSTKPPISERYWKTTSGSKRELDTGRVGELKQNGAYQCAMLFDQPGRERAGRDNTTAAFHHRFEVAAIRMKAEGDSVFAEVIGFLTWGYKVEVGLSNVPDEHIVSEHASLDFLAAVEAWNKKRRDMKIPLRRAGGATRTSSSPSSGDKASAASASSAK